MNCIILYVASVISEKDEVEKNPKVLSFLDIQSQSFQDLLPGIH